jgi:threonyl-tRNA synthetase
MSIESESRNIAQPPDHKAIGQALGLFHFDASGAGAFWQGPGMAIYNALGQLWRECNEEMDYEEVRSPQLYSAELWRRSGHWEKYQDLMFHFGEGEDELGLKPMNCPGHCLIYSHRPRSWRELPLRLSEQGLVHRLELSGNVNGLLRARSFSIDDAHLFCREDQIEDEVRACLALAKRIYGIFELGIDIELSLRPDNRIGSNELWDKAEGDLRRALSAEGADWRESAGEGAFYGPKIDIHVSDSLGRDWQLGSIQLDYQLPLRFDLRYIGQNGKDHELVEGEKVFYRPVMVHRAMFGSFERFIAILLEHFDGALPAWCAPRPCVVLPRGREDLAYAENLARDLRGRGVRAQVKASGSLGKRIRQAEAYRVPVMLIIGPREREANSAAWRGRDGEQDVLAREDAIARLAQAVRERKLRL